MALFLLHLDSRIEFSQEGLGKYFFVANADSARSILSTISGAMIGVAGTVFSITLVALTLASSQFGSRLIKNFMYVRLNQVVLGSYIATYIYCLLVLNTIKTNDSFTYIPSLSILIALLTAVINIILLIVFIHKIAVSIQAENVITDISEAISKNVKVLFPEKMGEASDEEQTLDLEELKKKYEEELSVIAPKGGYVQYIDSEVLIELVQKNDALLVLHYRPGDYWVEGQLIGKLYAHEPLEDDAMERIQQQFLVGKKRTSQQDMEFSIHQMVEIASRALSPGVNDPYTAIACIDNLTATMAHLSQVKFPSKYRYDDEDQHRVVADTLDFEGMLDASFNQIRQFSEGSTAVIIRLMEAMITIHEMARWERHKRAIIKHAQMILNVGERTIEEHNDLEDLKERSHRLLQSKD